MLTRALIDRNVLLSMVAEAQACLLPFYFFFEAVLKILPIDKSCDKIAQPDGLTLLAIRSDVRRKSRERAHLANLIADI